jgi:cytochrome c oxidase subunit IV
MSAHSSAGPAPVRSAARAPARDTGSGWVGFAGTMLAIVGTLNVIYGIGAIGDARVYVGETQYIFGDLNTWGWFLVLVGAVQVVAAFGIWSRTPWARVVGVVCASANALLQVLFMPAFPLLALALLAIDVLVIYGLMQHGGRTASASR